MTRFIYTLTLLFGLSLSVLAESCFDRANTAYAEGDYPQADMLYHQVLDSADRYSRRSQAELYCNLGDAQFKQGELSQAILSYHRALRLQPSYSPARHNLRFAESRITDNIADKEAFFLSSGLRFLRDSLTQSAWLWIAFAAWLLVLAGVTLFLLGHMPAWRKTGFWTAIVSMLIVLTATSNAASIHHRDTARSEAIITQGVVNAKSAPDRSGTDLFTLHEGTEVRIRETVGAWCNIRVGNYEGWIPQTDLERI